MRHSHLVDLELVEDVLQDLVVLNHLVLVLCVEVHLQTQATVARVRPFPWLDMSSCTSV